MLHRGKTFHPLGQKSQSLGDKFSLLGDTYITHSSIKRCSGRNHRYYRRIL